MLSTGGFGKTILCGEHFVVHGLPGIVSTLPLKTYARAESAASMVLIDERPKPPGYLPIKSGAYRNMLCAIAAHFGIQESLKVTLHGTLPVSSGGLGSSAAAAVAIARALAPAQTDRKIYDAALAGERVVHGNPSGIDVSAAVFGGIQHFVKGQEPEFFRDIELPFILVDSGVCSDTKAVIADVARLKEEGSMLWGILVEQYMQIYAQIAASLTTRDLVGIGVGMHRCQQLLASMQLSHKIVDNIVESAAAAGALGAKVTGTGRGGLVLVLARDNDHQTVLADRFSRQGYFVIVR